jgi:phospholipid transport system substrate-binding protein
MTMHAKRKTALMRAAALAGALTCLLTAGAAHAQVQSAAETFVRQDADKVIAVLNDKSLGEADKRARVAVLMTSLLDLKRMAMFTLGPAAKTASPADLDAYVAAYREFALANYAAELSGYMGQSLQLTGAAQRAPGDFIVNATVADPSDKSDPPSPVSFRVLDEGGGKFALVDASIAGIWFTIAQRDDFTGYLSQNGGDMGKLVAHLKALAAHPQSASQASR